MKNLPNKFPTRYALIAQNLEIEELEDFRLKNVQIAKTEGLFNQFISKLQKESLSRDILLNEYSSVQFYHFNTEIADIAKLGSSTEWIDTLEKEFLKILPQVDMSATFRGKAFSVGLYSYQGNTEIPAFIRAHNAVGNQKLQEGFGFISRGDLLFFRGTYQRICTNKISDWQLYQLLNEYERPIYITSNQSSIWKALDKGILNGTTPPDNIFYLKNPIMKKIKDQSFKEKINIMVCRNWQSLFAEEIRTLYKMFCFCNNCDKPLPLNYKGSYCLENQECKKERARKRSKKRNVTKKQSNL